MKLKSPLPKGRIWLATQPRQNNGLGADLPAALIRSDQRVGEAAKMPFSIHPHMLHHASGFKLANDGHDTRALQHYLGHKNIQHTVRYTEMAPDRFKDFWRDCRWRGRIHRACTEDPSVRKRRRAIS